MKFVRHFLQAWRWARAMSTAERADMHGTMAIECMARAELAQADMHIKAYTSLRRRALACLPG